MAPLFWIIGPVAALFGIAWAVGYLRHAEGDGDRIAAANAQGRDALRALRDVIAWAAGKMQGLALLMMGLFFLTIVFIEGVGEIGWTVVLGALAVIAYGIYHLVD